MGDEQLHGSVFLSHTGKDAAGRTLTPELHHHLTQQNPDRRVFIDEKSIKYGANLNDVIKPAIQHCDVFVAIVTEQYLHNKWPLLELHWARKYDRPVFAALVEVSVDEVKRWVRSDQALEVWKREKLIQAAEGAALEQAGHVVSAEALRADVLGLFGAKVLEVTLEKSKFCWINAASLISGHLLAQYPDAGWPVDRPVAGASSRGASALATRASPRPGSPSRGHATPRDPDPAYPPLAASSQVHPAAMAPAATVSLVHDAGASVLDELIRLAGSATVHRQRCRKLGATLSSHRLPLITKFICTLAQQPGNANDASGVHAELLDELDDLLSRAKYWLLCCQPTMAGADLHAKAPVREKLAEVLTAVNSFNTDERQQELAWKVYMLERAQQELARDLYTARCHVSTQPPAAEASTASQPGLKYRRLSVNPHPPCTGSPDGFHSDPPDDINARLRDLNAAATADHIRPAGIPYLRKRVFQHVDALVPQIAQQLLLSEQVGIVGMAGLGKTTIARAVFEAIKGRFSGQISLFVTVGHGKDPIKVLQRVWKDLFGSGSEVPDGNAAHLVHELAQRLHGNRILLVLDDVWDAETLKLLNFAQLNGHDEHQRGNRVIVTTRDPDVLAPQPDMKPWQAVEPPRLSADNACKLLCWHAFGTEGHPEEYEEVVRNVLHRAQGLPLMLQVLGAELRGKPVPVWQARLKALSDAVGSGSVTEQLRRRVRPSVDALPPLTRRCFTVFAAFEEDAQVYEDTLITIFSGICPFQASTVWAHQQLDLLCSKCLIAKSSASRKSKVFMHDILWDVAGLEAQRHLHIYDLWHCQRPQVTDISTPFECDARVVVHRQPTWQTVRCAPSVCVLHAPHRSDQPLASFQFEEPECSSVMRVLTLGRCSTCCPSPSSPSRSPSSSPEDPCSSVARLLLLQHLSLSTIAKPLPDCIGQLAQLQTLHLGWCKSLTVLPDSIGKLAQLQMLSLEWCDSLTVLPDSIGQLAQLQTLKLDRCKSLMAIPGSIGQLTQLQTLGLQKCKSLKVLPDSIGQLAQLQTLYLAGCKSIAVLPDSIGQLAQLQTLDLAGCESLKVLPNSIGQFAQLQTLDLAGCEFLMVLPDSIGDLAQLQTLDLAGCESLTVLPDSIGQLAQLQTLSLKSCESLMVLPDSIGQLAQLQTLDLRSCESLTELPDSIGQLAQLQMCRVRNVDGADLAMS